MPKITINGVGLFYEELGSGTPVILHHGYTGSHDVWLKEIAPRLADRYRCIVMDARGAGDSDHPADGYNIAQYADDVISMADALDLEKFTYVGHSMGGGIGYQLALHYPQRLDKLVLVAPIPSQGIGDNNAAHKVSARRRTAPDGRAEMIAERSLLNLRSSQDAIERGIDRALSVSDGHFEESWRSMQTFDVSNRLHELTTPTLMVAGAADGLAAANVRDWLNLPNATIHIFSRVGHGVPGDVPEAFAEALRDFFAYGVVNAQTQQEKLTAD